MIGFYRALAAGLDSEGYTNKFREHQKVTQKLDTSKWHPLSEIH